VDRFTKAVFEYQKGGVDVKMSLSALNLSQQLLMQGCLGLCLVISANAIRAYNDCVDGLDESSEDECVGMDTGDFVSVLTYVRRAQNRARAVQRPPSFVLARQQRSFLARAGGYAFSSFDRSLRQQPPSLARAEERACSPTTFFLARAGGNAFFSFDRSLAPVLRLLMCAHKHTNPFLFVLASPRSPRSARPQGT
jgi:hypothetical protein